MRCVLDTNVVVAALRSPSGASAELLRAALRGEFRLVLSVAMVLEYEAVCCDPRQRIESGLQEEQVRMVVDTLCDIGEYSEPRYQWRPQLRDPNDEMVLEAAINGKADALVTFNRKDFGTVPERFGNLTLSPREALASRRTGISRTCPQCTLR